MNIMHGDSNAVEQYFSQVGTYVEEETTYFNGFELMQPYMFSDFKLGDTPENGCQYLIALNDNDEVCGVLKWKRYSLPDHQFVPENEAEPEDNYNAIRLIDVRKDQRNIGIAKTLMRAFSNLLSKEEFVVGGRATSMGKVTNIHEWMEREVKQKYYISETRLVEDWEEENAVW